MMTLEKYKEESANGEIECVARESVQSFWCHLFLRGFWKRKKEIFGFGCKIGVVKK